MHRIFALNFLLLASALFVAEAQDDEFRLRVLGRGMAPVADAEILLLSHEGLQLVASTDSKGYANVTTPSAPGVIVKAASYAPMWVTLYEQGSAQVVDVRLRSETVLSGTVTDYHGQPLSGVEIAAWLHQFAFLRTSTETDSQGEFRLNSLVGGLTNFKAGSYSHTAIELVQNTGYFRARGGKLELLPYGHHDVKVRLLQRGVMVLETVDSTTGAPLENVFVDVVGSWAGDLKSSLFWYVADSELSKQPSHDYVSSGSRHEFVGWAEGDRLSLALRATGYAPIEKTFEVMPFSDATPYRVEMLRQDLVNARFSGTLTTTDPPIHAGRVFIVAFRSESAQEHFQLTQMGKAVGDDLHQVGVTRILQYPVAADGAFSTDQIVLDSPTDLVVLGPTIEPARVQSVHLLDAQERLALEIPVKPYPIRISGTVTRDAFPRTSEISIEARGHATSPHAIAPVYPLDEERTYFDFGVNEPGLYLIRIYRPDVSGNGWPNHVVAVDVQEGQKVRLHIGDGSLPSLSATVTVAGIRAVQRPYMVRHPERGVDLFKGFTDSAGRIKIGDVYPRPYKIMIGIDSDYPHRANNPYVSVAEITKSIGHISLTFPYYGVIRANGLNLDIDPGKLRFRSRDSWYETAYDVKLGVFEIGPAPSGDYSFVAREDRVSGPLFHFVKPIDEDFSIDIYDQRTASVSLRFIDVPESLRSSGFRLVRESGNGEASGLLDYSYGGGNSVDEHDFRIIPGAYSVEFVREHPLVAGDDALRATPSEFEVGADESVVIEIRLHETRSSEVK